MGTVYLVKYNDFDETGIVRAFETEREAIRFKLLLDAEKNPLDNPTLFFNVETVKIYNTCEEVAKEEEDYEY